MYTVGHLLHDVQQLPFLVRPGLGQRLGAHLLGHALAAVAEHVHREPKGEKPEDGPDPGEAMAIDGLARAVHEIGRVEIDREVAAEAEPEKEEQEAGHQPPGLPAVGGLLLEQIEGRGLSHCLDG
jgi:hypothetical protein